MSEKDEIKRSKMTAQKNSGRGPVQKGDATLSDRWLVDIKEYSKSFGLSINVWAKVTSDAIKTHRIPALKIVLGDEGSPRTRLWVISDADMQNYVRLYEKDMD